MSFNTGVAAQCHIDWNSKSFLIAEHILLDWVSAGYWNIDQSPCKKFYKLILYRLAAGCLGKERRVASCTCAYLVILLFSGRKMSTSVIINIIAHNTTHLGSINQENGCGK